MHFFSFKTSIVFVLIALLLSACGTAPTVPPDSQAKAAPAGKPAPVLPKAGSGRGGYYKDDGPGENPPDGLELTLDAEPKIEPYSVAANKPYVVFGKTYTPLLADVPFTQRGIGSWYGVKFHGQRTSSGEPYDMYKMTAAHPTLPIPSYARITNTRNGKQVIVKINDRGPFQSSRILDMSYTAALKLDYLGKGSSELIVERLLPADIEKMAENKKKGKADTVTAAVPAPVLPVVSSESTSAKKYNSAADKSAYEMLMAQHADNRVNGSVTAQAGAGNIPVATSPNSVSGFYLQFGAYGLRSNAETIYRHLANSLESQIPPLEIVQQGTLYRLFSGPFISRADAMSALQLALNIGVAKPVIVQR